MARTSVAVKKHESWTLSQNFVKQWEVQ